ncbi:hypothetical protein JCM10908_000866 [Rhodotorula pacifica]|uniref:nitrogen permease regulating protein NPR2 n=1 Tax=Rhodotorula pacifica TaxID=1495444 RepID=UPI0031805874
MTTSRQLLKEESGSYTPKLVAVFYAVFDPTLGPRVVHQIPEGSVATALSTFPSRTATPGNGETPAETVSGEPGDATEPAVVRANPVLFDFSSILDFVIPKPELCGHLITKATRTSKILGFPIRIVDEEKYHGTKSVYNRNAFIFNVCFVFERDAELSVYEPVVRKTGRTLSALEEHSSLLSSPPPDFSMANLLEQLYLDLNAYFETSIPLLGVDLDVGLFPFYMNPPEVRMWEVPVAVTNLEQMKTRSWDVTLYKICSFIDGVNHVKRIAELAEVDLYLARQCIQHLVYYNAVITTDIFQFSNSYALLPDIADAVQYAEEEDEGATDLPTECENYVFSGEQEATSVPFATLLSYYSRLRPGFSLAEWIELLSLDSQPIDIRRMIQFGVIKGFLRRVYAYPVWLDHPNLQSSRRAEPAARSGRSASLATASGTATPLASMSRQARSRPLDAPALPQHSTSAQPSRTTTPLPPPAADFDPRDLRSDNAGRVDDEDDDTPSVSYPPSLALMLDGTHHTDEICLKYACSWRTLELVLRHLGDGGKVGGGDASADEDDAGRGGDGGGGPEVPRRGSAASAWDQAAGGYGDRVVMLHI